MMKNKERKMKTRAHRVLFDRDLPFTPKVEQQRNKYQRHAKHKKQGD